MEVELRQVTKDIRGVRILDGMNYTFRGGRIYGLRGKNGCGKTMLLRSIAGLMKPTAGEIRINGQVLYRDMEVPESVGVLIENPAFLPEYTGLRNLQLLAGIRKRITKEETARAMEQVGLDPADKRKVRKYSLGMKQRLGIAAAIMEQPELILLDEPINAIDEGGVEQIRKLLLSLVTEERILIVACHDREELDLLADTVLLLAEGRIVGEE